MTPKEKAIQLVAKYKSQSFGITTNFQHFKQYAIIAVDEILESNNFLLKLDSIGLVFWKQVKKEIDKL
jgi:hypothetical protein